jgi:uncharacterized protein YkwD
LPSGYKVALLIGVAAVVATGLGYSQGIVRLPASNALGNQDSLLIGDMVAGMPTKSAEATIVISDSIKSSRQIPPESLRVYALELINKDRVGFGLSPVALSSNQAAQVHAEDVFATQQLSHWMTNGEKPYMTYTLYEGVGYVAQNVGISGYQDRYESCRSGIVSCGAIIEPYQDIKDLHRMMVYNDAFCCQNGHRDNILDKHHTHVSIGIAYDDYALVLVQNFENNYLELSSPLTTTNNYFVMDVSVLEGTLEGFSVFYDPYPTPRQYEIHKDDNSYDIGEFIATVQQPAPPGYYYPSTDDDIVIEANSWELTDQGVKMYFDINRVVDKPGVYTVIGWINDGEEGFPGFSYSLFVEPRLNIYFVHGICV